MCPDMYSINDILLSLDTDQEEDAHHKSEDELQLDPSNSQHIEWMQSHIMRNYESIAFAARSKPLHTPPLEEWPGAPPRMARSRPAESRDS